MSVTDPHEEKETILVDVTLPGHDERVTTSLFTRTRKAALEACGHRCEVSGEPESECGPLELHHFWVERCLATAVDFKRLLRWLRLVRAKADAAIQWLEAKEAAGTDLATIDPVEFTDDMGVNGLALSKRLHTGKGEGIHAMPFPLWTFWAIGKPGFQFCGQDQVIDETAAPDTTFPS